MAEQFNLLIAEDDQILATSLKMMVPQGFKVFIASKPELVPDHVFFHAAMIDMHLVAKVGEIPDGPRVIAQVLAKNPQTEIISMSGNLDRHNMELAIKAGAQRFLAKPLLAEEVTLLLEKILAYWRLRQFEQSPQFQYQLVGKSEQTENLRKKIASLKNEQTSVLIEGETGTGKEIVARFLNQQEGRRPFITVNCAALNENLFESEFFGHLKGSFTGADEVKIGLAEAAHGGDLFLDEIEALPLSLQAKLLRFLESGEIRKVGAKEFQHVQVRCIAASNQPLQEMIQEKKFREDLYFRLSSNKFILAPLRERPEDIEQLCHFFIDLQKPRRNKSIDPDAIDLLKKYTFPGNVRELKRLCEQFVLTSALPVITRSDVEQLIFPKIHDQSDDQKNYELSLDVFLQKQEKKYLEFQLRSNKNLDEVISKTQISKSSLYKKIKDYGITYE